MERGKVRKAGEIKYKRRNEDEGKVNSLINPALELEERGRLKAICSRFFPAKIAKIGITLGLMSIPGKRPASRWRPLLIANYPLSIIPLSIIIIHHATLGHYRRSVMRRSSHARPRSEINPCPPKLLFASNVCSAFHAVRSVHAR